jgi:hypothetical protein
VKVKACSHKTTVERAVNCDLCPFPPILSTSRSNSLHWLLHHFDRSMKHISRWNSENNKLEKRTRPFGSEPFHLATSSPQNYVLCVSEIWTFPLYGHPPVQTAPYSNPWLWWKESKYPTNQPTHPLTRMFIAATVLSQNSSSPVPAPHQTGRVNSKCSNKELHFLIIYLRSTETNKREGK